MAKYILRRLVLSIPVLIGISLITFVLIYYLPADPARMYAGPNASVETVARIREEMGLNDPLWVQYFRYLTRALHGDLGFSYDLQMPVLQMILDRFPYTLQLIIGGIFVELAIGVPVGIISAIRQYSWWDRAGMVLALLGVSMPPFWLGLLLLFFFSFKVPIFPLGGTGSFRHLILPALTAGLGGAAWYARMARSSTLEVLTADYVRTARAKGLPFRKVIFRHVLPNALNPIITMAGMDIPWFVGGVVLVEQVFAWPGIGRMAVEAIIEVDIPLIMGTVVFTAVLVVTSSILIDIVQGFLDPRIRHQYR
ncbi:MAG: ABC transporter permease [Anaerolineae bacterium]|nr:ABC transporter permease [Anaerolineae bacterium]